MPSSTGIEMSRIKISGPSLAVSLRTTWPSRAVVTTSNSGSRSRASTARNSSWSSAKSTRPWLKGFSLLARVQGTDPDPHPAVSTQGAPRYGFGVTTNPSLSPRPEDTGRSDRYLEGLSTGSRLEGYEVMLDGKLHQLGARSDPEILHHGVLVIGNRPRGDRQDAGDLLHGAAFREQLEDLALPRAQLPVLPRLPRLMEQGADQSSCGQRRDVGTSLEDLLDGLEQLRGRRVLEQISRGPDPERFHGEIGIFTHREEDQPDLGHKALQLTGGVETVEQWHGNVEDDDIRPNLGGKCEQGTTISDAPDDVATGFEQLRECLPDQAMIIRQQDTRARHYGLPSRTDVI